MPPDIYEETDNLLSEYPDLEEDLAIIVKKDQRGTWEFSEIPLDSGLFGELVSRGIAEQSGEGYRLVDRQAVADALHGDAPKRTQSKGSEDTRIERVLSDITLKRVGAILGSLLLVVGFRLFAYPQVFQNGDIVLLGNDPYYYRYWVETLLANTEGPITLKTLGSLPEPVANGEPLFVVTLVVAATFLGGNSTAAGVTLAWYPVVSAVFVGGITYLLATRLFADRRVGVATVGMLAIIPVHGFRSGLGFADHHAFDYFWLAATMLTLVILSEQHKLRDSRLWIAIGGFGLATTGQVLAWEAGPLLLLPIGLFLATRSLLDIQADRSPLRFGGPVLIGLGFCSLLVYLAHRGLAWHTSAVVSAPFLLFVGSSGIIFFAEGAWRWDLSPKYVATGEVVGLLAGVNLLPKLVPSVATTLARGRTFLVQTEGIAESISILSGRLGSIFGPAFLFGWVLFLALPYLCWLSFRAYREHDSVALVPVVYGWTFLILAVVQLRFAGELSIPIAVLAGLGFVHLTAWIDLSRGLPDFSDYRPPESTGTPSQPVSLSIPDRRTVLLLFVTFLLIGSMSFAMTPLKTNQLVISDEEYQAVTWMDEYSAEQDWEYPENYVLSIWGKNRFYNYFVSGEAASYQYAESHYGEFLTSSAGEQWYSQLHDRVGFIVLRDSPPGPDFTAESLQTRLHTHYGSESAAASGLSHYRLVYISDDASLTVFTLVPGARLAGTAPPGSTVSVSTTQSVTGEQFTYSRTVEADSTGQYAVTVPYPGEYTVGGSQMQVSPTAITANETISVPAEA
ncbi:STT3 domain-containing protein [Haloplanus halophilus]|uniref:STT3 domain-containing protein n=1 Tax=Haloplanus halophilus TaxID=2949993 RepID=UPI00203C474E|nr:STT3 domain-containing protein [Haloplanus sp. GDY1]